MLISNGSALNILLANNNRVLNDALKEADNKTLNNLLKQDSSNSSSSTNTAASSILKEVLNSIKDGTKSNSTLENILKNSTAFKDLGNLSSNLSSLLESIKDDESLQKFKPLLENFLKNIKDVTADNLKEQIKNSGIFLENKLSSNPNAKLENLLQNISNLIKTIDTPEAKNSSQIIDNILKNIPKDGSLKSSELVNNLKTLVSSLQNLSSSLNSNQTQTLNNLANELKNFIQNGSMIESKTENLVPKTQTPQTEDVDVANTQIKNLINNQVKELLTQIKQDLTQNQNIIQNKNILPLIDKLISLPDLFSKSEAILNSVQNSNISNFSNNFATNLNPLLTALKESLQAINPKNIEIQNQINSLIKKVENIIQEYTNNNLDNPKDNQKLDNDFKSILLKMQDEIAQKTDIKSQDSLKTINNLLTQIDMQQLTSLVSNSNFVYIPFFWEMLEDGTVEIKEKEEDKFFCQIKLTLKDFGKIDLMLSMYDENKLDMTIYAQREHFKVTLRDNLQKLKLALNEANIIPMNVKLLDMKEESETQEQKPTNVYQNNYNNDFITSSRIDIKA